MPCIDEINDQLEIARNSAKKIEQQINHSKQEVESIISKAAQKFGGGLVQSQLASSLSDAARSLRIASGVISSLQSTIQECERYNAR